MHDSPHPPLDHAATLWTPMPDLADLAIQRDAWTARPYVPRTQLLVSGNLSKAREALAPASSEVGLWGIATTRSYAVRIARDRMLLVSDDGIDARTGWNADGFAVSAAEDSFHAVDLAGAGVEDLVAEGTSVDLATGSPSAAIQFAGLFALLYRTSEGAARLHVEAPYATALWHWLASRSD